MSKQWRWSDLRDLEKFKSPDWAERISHLSPDELSGGREIPEYLRHPHERLRNLVEQLKDKFVDKDDIIEMMCICAIAQEPMLIFGAPGTAKSELVVRFCELLGIRRGADTFYFEYLLNQYTEPDELFGPIDLKALKGESSDEKSDEKSDRKQVVRRIDEGMLPQATVVFLDEVFRGSSAILNTLLSIINERRYYESGRPKPAKTLIIFGAANEPPPNMPELRAFYERFPIRLLSGEVDKGKTELRLGLLDKGWKLELERNRAIYNPDQHGDGEVACLNDLLLANRVIMERYAGEDMRDRMERSLTRYTRIITVLHNNRPPVCSIDDRKFIRLWKIILASAFLREGGVPKPLSDEDFRILKHTWHSPEHAYDLEKQVLDAIEEI